MHGSISLPGGFAVSNTDDDVVHLSPSRLATYADCKRKFDHDYVKDVSTPDQNRLYLNQGLAYHETIEAVCEATDPDDDAEVVHRRAMNVFDEKWNAYLDPNEYESRAHQAYQRAENRAAIDAFFDPDDGDGIRHARQSVATEKWLEAVHDGIGLHGYADNILRTDDGLHIIDYKRGLSGIITSYTAQYLAEHLAGETHEPGRVKNAFQTATYIEGVKQSDLYEEWMDVRFSFYALFYDTTAESTPDGFDISVRGRPRETTGVYDEYYETIWDLIETAHDGITTGDYEPVPFELINEEACPDCDYQEMCPEYLAEEVRR
jgi:putative RecB family exonuclease